MDTIEPNRTSPDQDMRAKKPWVKPRVRSSAVLDRRALMACSGRPQFRPGPPPFGCTGIISG